MLGIVVLVQADLNERRMLCGVAGVDGRQIGRHADVGDDHLQVVSANHLANVIFHSGNVLIRHLQARAGWGFHVDDELSGIRAREEGKPQQREEGQAHDKAGHDDDDRRLRTAPRPCRRHGRTCASIRL